MPLASTLTMEDRFRGLFVGPKHSGKTVAACSFLTKGGTKRIYDFDFDGRIHGVMAAPWLEKERIEYKYYPPRVGRNQQPTYIQVNDDCEAMLAQSITSMLPYETIIGDSLTAETFAMLANAIPLTHTRKTEGGQEKQTGKRIGALQMAGPEDYGFEASATYSFLAFLRSLPGINLICTAHIIDKYGKADPDDPFSESIITGEKLSLRDKIGVNIGVYFDHIFKFDRRMVGGHERFFVTFRSSIACTSYPNLPEGEFDITGKNFYHDVLLPMIRKEPVK